MTKSEGFDNIMVYRKGTEYKSQTGRRERKWKISTRSANS